jgi:tetratricopeptide (TPR) repeat protein
MWKSITAAINRLVQKSYDEAAAAKPTPPTGAAPDVRAHAHAPAHAPVTREELQQKFQQAVLLLQAGNRAAAEQTISALVARVSAAQPNGPLHAEALSKQATILAAAGDWPAAESACRAAIAIPAPSDVLRKERLGYQLLLADVLAPQGKLDEAENLLRAGLAERRTLFGEQNANYAIGLSALAELLVTRARPAEALPLVQESVRLLGAARHDQLPHDLALRAYVIKMEAAAAAAAADGFATWEALSDDVRNAVVHHCVKRAPAADPRAARSVLIELRQRLDAQPGAADVPLRVSVNVALANAARSLADHETRIDACRRMVALCEPLPERSQLATAQMALAMALSDAARGEEANAAYATAAATARQTQQLALMSTVLRNYAQWADAAALPEEADRLYREAVDHGASSGDWSTHGQSTVAYGIFLHKQGRLDEARGLLEEAVAHLPPSHPDLPRAREHLRELGADGDDT